MRVLIVDDYPGLIELYDVALGARGFEVVGAATAGEALTRAASERFDAVVLDIELPDGNGVDILERLRVIPALARASLVGMSSWAPPGVRGLFDGFLAKPFHPKRLASLLRRLQRRAPHAARVIPSCT